MTTYKKVILGAIVGFAIGSVVANPAYVTGGAGAQGVAPVATAQPAPSWGFSDDYQLKPNPAEAPVYEY